MSTLGKWRLLICLLVLFAPLLTGGVARAAGPPFQMDDPDVIPFHHFEFYTFSNLSSTPGVTGVAAPALELNWSGVHNVMFHFLVPAAEALPAGGPNTFGLGDSEAGMQVRIIPEGKFRPMMGTFPMMEIPTGNPARGLGAGKPSWKVPLWMQKGIGPWTLDWGGGENLSHIPGTRNFTFGGAFLQRDVSKKLSLAGEVFSHGRELVGDPRARFATMIDFGGYYTLRDPGPQLLFCYGHSVAGQNETYAYVGLYWTWGPKEPKDAGPKISRLLQKM